MDDVERSADPGSGSSGGAPCIVGGASKRLELALSASASAFSLCAIAPMLGECTLAEVDGLAYNALDEDSPELFLW